MPLLLWLVACTTPVVKAPEPDTSDPTAHDTASPDTSDTTDTADTAETDTSPPCTPMAALFFDLGETLVVEREDGLFETRDGVPTLLDALVEQGLPLGVITTVPRSWDMDDLWDLLVDPGVLDPFTVVLLSSEAESSPKPDPAIYAEALSLLPSPPPIGTTAFVTEELGDLTDGDPPTEGAMAAGMIGVLLSDEASPQVDHTVAPDALPSIATAPWLACIEAE